MISRRASILSNMRSPLLSCHFEMDRFLTELLWQTEQRGTAFIPCSTGVGYLTP